MYYEQSKIFHDIKNRAKYFLKNIEQEDQLNFTHEYFQFFTNCSNTLFEIILIQQIITCNKFSSLCQITALDLTLHFFQFLNIPLTILTATTVTSSCSRMPIASALMTRPNAP